MELFRSNFSPKVLHYYVTNNFMSVKMHYLFKEDSQRRLNKDIIASIKEFDIYRNYCSIIPYDFMHMACFHSMGHPFWQYR